MRNLSWSLLVLIAAGCGNRNDSLVVVTLSSVGALSGVAKVRTHAVAGGKGADFDLSPSGGAVATPITYGIDLPRTIGGAITVQAELLNATGGSLGSGSGSATIVPGQRTNLAIEVNVAQPASDMAQPSIGGAVDMAPASPDLASVPMLTIDNALLPFGSVTQGKVSATAQFVISNSGTAATGTPILSQVGDSSDFQISTDCNAPLQYLDKCHVTVAFAPSTMTAGGAKDVKLKLSASPGGDVMGEVTGTALTPGVISMMPDIGDCGASVLGTLSPTAPTFTVHNGGTTATGKLSVMLSDTKQFSSTGCNQLSLAASASCVVTVSFTPSNRGSAVCSIVVQDSPANAATASAKGVGQLAATLSISPSSYPFPGGPHGVAAQTQTFTVSNIGDVPTAKLQASKISGTNATAFAIPAGQDTCQGAAVGATPCTVAVQFTPQLTGAHSATLEIHDSTTPPLATAMLTGTGTPNWVREYSASRGGSSDTLWSVWAADAADVWAVGDEGHILKRASSGSWTSQAINSTDNYSLVTGSSATDVWIASKTGPLRSTGAAFANSGLGLTGQVIGGIMVFAANDVYALATTTAATPTESLNHYNGSGAFTVAAGSSVPVGTQFLWSYNFAELFSTYSTSTCSLGQCTDTSDILYDSSLSAFTDTPQFTETTAVTWRGRIWGSGFTDVYCGGDGKPLHSDGGSTWTRLNSTAPDDVYSIWGSSSSDIYLVGSAGIAHGDGTTWGTPVQPNGVVPLGVWGTAANDVYVSGSDNDGYCIYHWY